MDNNKLLYKFKILLISDSYIGYDTESDVVIQCQPITVINYYTIEFLKIFIYKIECQIIK
jgi:hypothetical protein